MNIHEIHNRAQAFNAFSGNNNDCVTCRGSITSSQFTALYLKYGSKLGQ